MLKPEIDKTCYIAEGAIVIGNVLLEKKVSVWFNSVIRADLDIVKIGENTNIQDLVMIHTDKNFPTIIGNNCSIGHHVVLHGCQIGNNVLVGMNATILNGAQIGNNCIIGANSLVTSHTVIPDNHLAFGNPAKVIRALKKEEIAKISENANHYCKLSRNYKL
ncbi:gamma carbonic anhydrase family protein [Mycoplasmatota bacterium]|nr:gamma carbonic anhydrase family protein [Mycoplasmatota bacterium]